MFANTQMMLDQFDDACRAALGRVKMLTVRATQTRSISPEQAKIFDEMHVVLERMHAQIVNQGRVIQAQQAALNEVRTKR